MPQWITKLAMEFGEGVAKRIAAALGENATESEARAAAKKIVKAPAKKATPSLAAKPQKPLAVQRKALPAPPKRLALPAPGPGLPPLASKPRGGQWWVDKPSLDYGNSSPEEAARQGALSLALTRWVPDDDYGVVGRDAEGRLRDALLGGQTQTVETDAQKWLERALTKYYKNDFGSPEDPLRDLAARGLHYDPDMTPEKWQATVNSYLMEDPIQQIMFPPNPAGGMPGAGSNLRGETMAAMPWLAKVPATDKVYGISGGGLDLGHFTDEFLNALNDPEASGLPLELAVRPESLGRMTFPQAVEHVGKINQYRAKEMQRAALSNLDSPAIQAFKEYPEDNPMGLRWVELKAPEPTGGLPQGWKVSPDEDGFISPEGEFFYTYPGQAEYDSALEDALKYEGRTMGHCVGDYCPDVMSGRTRIFSLRDAKGEPHVTIETQPGSINPTYDERDELFEQARQEIEAIGIGDPDTEHNQIMRRFNELLNNRRAELEANPPSERIMQIKGKQNRAPKDDYLPFVQDFVKSQQWSNVGDLANTGLVRLPDGRYITEQQAQEALSGVGGDIGTLDARYLDRLGEEAWKKIAPNFEGFAIGGRVDPDRCFCHNPLSVKKGR